MKISVFSKVMRRMNDYNHNKTQQKYNNHNNIKIIFA